MEGGEVGRLTRARESMSLMILAGVSVRLFLEAGSRFASCKVVARAAIPVFATVEGSENNVRRSVKFPEEVSEELSEAAMVVEGVLEVAGIVSIE